MFHFSNPLSGLDCWPEARRPRTPFARQKLEVDDGLSGGSKGGVTRVFSEKAYTDEFVGSWRKIATRFKGCEGIYGYDLINEPTAFGMAPDCFRSSADNPRKRALMKALRGTIRNP